MKLEGVKVLELALFLPGPHLAMMMADHGADVIKIEPYPAGEPARELGLRKAGMSVWFQNANRGKRSLRLNLKDPRGREVFMRLAESADVVVESFRPGVVDRLGVGYAEVARRAPQIIYCSLSAFGQTGVYRDKPAHDLAMEAMAGLLSVTLGQDGKPAMPGVPVADLAGSLMALSGILMALLKQRRTGRGDYLDISMHDALLAWTPNVMGPVFAEHRAPTPKHERSWGGAAFYNIYATADGAHLVLGGVEHKFAENLLTKAGRPDLIALCKQPPGPVQDPVKAFLRDFFGARPLAESLEWLADIDVCYAPVRTLPEGVFDPNTAARGMLLRDAAGTEHLGVPIKFRNEPAEPRLRAPALGEHSRAILAGLGYGAAEIDIYVREHVV